MKWWRLVVVVVIWSVLAYLFVDVFAGAHVCSILTPVGGATGPATDYETQMARCNRPDVGAILVVGIGYVVIIVAAVRTFRNAHGAK